MKKIVLVFFAVVLVSCKKEKASSKVKKENIIEAEKRDAKIAYLPKVVFDKEVHNFGTVQEGEVVEAVFVVTNSGKSDLIIIDARASCGCTVPTWSKKPIKPGSSTELKVRFNTSGRHNKQSKTVTLTTNTERGKETVKISGMVNPKNKQ